MPRKYERQTEKGKWTEETLKQAIAAIKSGRKIREVSRAFGIHEATLRTKIKSGQVGPPRLGRKTVFNEVQEKELADHIIKLALLFHGLNGRQVRRLAFEYADANGVVHNFDNEAKMAGRDWLTSFKKRHQGISLREPEPTSINRITAFNEEDVKKYFENLNSLLKKYNFTENRIYNVDESGITTVHKPGKILGPKGVKQIGATVSWERGKNITIICAFSAVGHCIPPMVIYPRQRISDQLKKGGPIGAVYGCSKNGWSNEELFLEWLKHLANYTKPSSQDPILLILDNHSSHISIEIFEYCRKHGIVMVTIPPHTSHRLQPLDLTFFGPLKAAFNRECELYLRAHVMERITPYDLAELLNGAFKKVATLDNAISGFRAAGIQPYNPDKFGEQDFAPAKQFLPIELEELEMDQAENSNKSDSHQHRKLIRENDQIAGSSTSNVPLRVQENCTKPVKVTDISPLPKPQPKRMKVSNRKQCSTILTATPEKDKLIAAKIKKESRISTLNKLGKKMPKKTCVIKKLFLTNTGKCKQRKRRVYENSDNSECSEVVDVKDLCDDDELDDINPERVEDVCLVCGEFGRDGEMWFRCVVCSLWSHEDCSGWDTAENYTCDHCLRKERMSNKT